MTKRWLVSVEYQPVYFYPDGSSRRSAAGRAVWIIDEHPALYVADAKQKLNELYRNPPPANDMPPRADDVLAIYSAIELPDGLLTDEQVDRLS